MKVTTTHRIEGYEITEYLGIVSAARVFAMLGGNKAAERGWRSAIQETTASLSEAAEELGADAVVGVQFQQIGSQLCATGTAVRLSQKQ